jgi:hypothetical protein
VVNRDHRVRLRSGDGLCYPAGGSRGCGPPQRSSRIRRGSGPPRTDSRPQHGFDKPFVRDWSRSTGWDQTPAGPEIPHEVVEATRQRYTEVYEGITGTTRAKSA